MNILIVLKKALSEEKFAKEHELLLKHAENWTGKDNDVYVLSGIGNDQFKNGSIHFVNPPGYLFNNLLVSMWFSIVNHPRFDFVIEELAVIPFLYRKSEKIFYIPGSLLKRVNILKGGLIGTIITLIIRLFYKHSYFFTSSWNTYDRLKDLGVKEKKIHLFKEGISFGNKKRSKIRSGKNMLFIAGGDLEKVRDSLQVFMAIERRDLDWKFTVIVPEALLMKTKQIYSDSGLVNPVKIVALHNSKVFLKEIENTNMVLDLMSDDNSLTNDLLALDLKIPVIAVDSEFFKTHPDIAKCFILSEKNDYFSLAQSALDLEVKEKAYTKKIELAEDLVKSYSWKSLADNSLNFLLSIRPK